MTSKNQSVGWVLWGMVVDHVSPSEHSEDGFGDTSMDGCTIAGVPDYKRIIFTYACEITIIRTESKLQDTF
jgi:hypothetical protein